MTSTLIEAPTTTLQRPDARGWTAWHLHLDTQAVTAADRVIADVAAPIARDSVQPWFFIRYWQGGPHVRLRIKGLTAEQVRHVDEELNRRLPGAAAVLDGEERIDPEAYMAEARRHAAGESGENRNVTALRPISVHPEPYNPEWERYGGDKVMQDSEKFFQVSSDIAATLSGEGLSRSARISVAVEATAAMARALSDEERDPYFEIGHRRWAGWAEQFGFDPAVVEQVSTQGVQALSQETGTATWSEPFRVGARELVNRLEGQTSAPAGYILSSHVHMFHNRLGLGLLDELRTHVLLAKTFPLSDEAREAIPQFYSEITSSNSQPGSGSPETDTAAGALPKAKSPTEDS